MTSTREQSNKDHLYAYSCALNLLLYATDPGPETLTVGGPGEQCSVSRVEALVDIYARILLLELRGDSDRLTAVIAEAQHHQEEADGDGEAETTAIRLAETALQRVRGAGADRDPKARERMLAAVDYQASRDVIGSFLGEAGLAGPPDALLAELRRIDHEGESDPGAD